MRLRDMYKVLYRVLEHRVHRVTMESSHRKIKGFKIFHTLGGEKGQSLLKFVCLFQIKFTFYIENIFFFKVVS